MTNDDLRYAVKNTVWFKSFNQDYREGGRYHDLETSEFKVIVILQAYANSYGEVKKEIGGGYSLSNELTKMLGMTYKTVIKCLMSLEEKKLIEVDSITNVIKLVEFVTDNGFRYSGGKESGRARKRMAQQSNKTSQNVDDIKKTLEEMLEGDVKNGNNV